MKAIVFLCSVFILSFCLLNNDSVSALSSDEACKDVSVVFARGSGSVVSTNRERVRIEQQVKMRLGGEVGVHFYELGTESYNDSKYPAVDVGNVFNGNAIGAAVSGGSSHDYGRSVEQGQKELLGYLQKRGQKCPNERIVLGGYSQGAQVMGGIYEQLALYANRIDFIALFGDPKLHLPEGEGIYPDACQGKNLSVYRRSIGSCHADNGSLGARKPYLSSILASKSGLWCKAQDYICGTSKMIYDTAGHGKYAEDGGAIDKAAKEIAERLKKSLGPGKSDNINTQHTQTGIGTTGLDVVFVIDTTGSMSSRINQAKAFARAQAEKIKELRGRVGLVAYRDVGDQYTAKIVSNLSEDQTEFQNGLDSLAVDGGGDTPEAALHALMTAFNGMKWKDGATKASVLLTDAGFHNPDRVDGSTIELVAKRSLEIDPVNVYPVVPAGYTASGYSELASKTSGQVIADDGNTEAALTKALTKIEQRPTALLKNTEYAAEVGKEITFDASDSYVIDAEITKYQWDFDGDGTFEQETTQPTANHTYTKQFDGTMQVRVSASNSTIANASAVVKIGTYVPPASPKAPTGVAAKIVSTKNGVSTLRLTWKATDALAEKWAVQMNGVALGWVPANQTTLEITDVQRAEDVAISVAGVAKDGLVGEATTTIVAKETTTSPQLTWWQLLLEYIRKLIQMLFPKWDISTIL